MVIGITGGIGAGKSFVLDIMREEFQARVIDADEVVHLLMQPPHSCYERIADTFGKKILDSKGEINRKKLGSIVFQDPQKLNSLNQILHPMVKQYIKGEISCSILENPTQIIVIEGALLIEDHYDKICDEIWYIYADENVRRERLKTYRGYTDEKIDSILKNQLTDQKFRENCHKIIVNNGEREKTLLEIKNALEF